MAVSCVGWLLRPLPEVFEDVRKKWSSFVPPDEAEGKAFLPSPARGVEDCFLASEMRRSIESLACILITRPCFIYIALAATEARLML